MALLIAPLFTAGIAIGGIQNAYAPGPECIVSPPDLVSWWPLDETSGTLAVDIADGNDGVHFNSPTPIAGKVDGALDFDGIGDFVNAGNPANLKLTTGTVDAWIKTSDAGSNFRGIAVKTDAYGMFLKNNVFGIFDWNTNIFRSTGINLADGQFHHVAFTFQSGVNDGTVLYIDGVAQPTTTMTVKNQNGFFAIGTNGGANQKFDGIIDEVEVFDRVLTPTEIKEIFDADDDGKCKEGCSSGFWKTDNKTKFGAQQWVGVTPDEKFQDTFADIDDLKVKGGGDKTDPSMFDALNTRGGGINALAREAVAALINSQGGNGVEYPLTEAEVVTIVDTALNTGAGFDAAVEDARALLFDLNHRVCPLSHTTAV